MNFADEIQVSEARAFYGFQMAMENIHSETYSLLIDQCAPASLRGFHALVRWSKVGLRRAVSSASQVIILFDFSRYIKDRDEKMHLFNAIETIPAVAAKANWAVNWMSRDRSHGSEFLILCITFYDVPS